MHVRLHVTLTLQQCYGSKFYVSYRLTQAASASWDQLKIQTTAGLQDAFKTRKHFEIDVTLHSPYLVVPENGSYSKDSHLLLVDLGKLTLKGSTKDPHSLDEVKPTSSFLVSLKEASLITCLRKHKQN